MDIKTKYELGDVLWYMEHNKALSQSVISISTMHSLDEDQDNKVVYYLNNRSFGMDEKNLYPSKEDLLKSL